MNKIDSAISALKKDFTREELAKMDKKEIKKFAKSKGFAIGTVLLAIALMAAIGAAIAIAAKSSSGDSSSQTAKLGASSIINQGAALKTTTDKYRINGASFAANQIVFNPYADGTATGSNLTLTTGTGVYGLFNPTNGINYTPLPASAVTTIAAPSAASCSSGSVTALNSPTADTNSCYVGKGGTVNAGYGGWYINKTFTSNAGTKAADTAIILAQVSQAACIEINKQVNGTTGMTTATIPYIQTANGFSSAAINITTGVTVGGSGTANWAGNTDYTSWTEGCMGNGAATGPYFYFNVVQAQ